MFHSSDSYSHDIVGTENMNANFQYENFRSVNPHILESQGIPFGRSSHSVKRTSNGHNFSNYYSNVLSCNNRSPTSTETEASLHRLPNSAISCCQNVGRRERFDPSTYQTPTYNGWHSLKTLPHPSQLKKKCRKRSALDDLEFKSHIYQLRKKSALYFGSEQNTPRQFPVYIHVNRKDVTPKHIMQNVRLHPPMEPQQKTSNDVTEDVERIS